MSTATAAAAACRCASERTNLRACTAKDYVLARGGNFADGRLYYGCVCVCVECEIVCVRVRARGEFLRNSCERGFLLLLLLLRRLFGFLRMCVC